MIKSRRAYIFVWLMILSIAIFASLCKEYTRHTHIYEFTSEYLKVLKTFLYCRSNVLYLKKDDKNYEQNFLNALYLNKELLMETKQSLEKWLMDSNKEIANCAKKIYKIIGRQLEGTNLFIEAIRYRREGDYNKSEFYNAEALAKIDVSREELTGITSIFITTLLDFHLTDSKVTVKIKRSIDKFLGKDTNIPYLIILNRKQRDKVLNYIKY